MGDGAAGFWYATIAGIAVCAVLISFRVRSVLGRPFSSAKAPSEMY
jgi:hypothetical protein